MGLLMLKTNSSDKCCTFLYISTSLAKNKIFLLGLQILASLIPLSLFLLFKELYLKAFFLSTQTYIKCTYIYFFLQDPVGDLDIVVLDLAVPKIQFTLGQVQITEGEILDGWGADPEVFAVPVDELARFLFPVTRQGLCSLVPGIPVVFQGPLDRLDQVFSSELCEAATVEFACFF
jgi:hypothetical protein